MASGPLLRDRRGTVWYYAGLGVVRLASALVALALVGGVVLFALLHHSSHPSPSVAVASPSAVTTGGTMSATPGAPSSVTPAPSAHVAKVTTTDTAIGYPIEKVNDPGLKKGVQQVRQKGVNGVQRSTFTDGRLTSTVVLRTPVPEILAVGGYVAPKVTTHPVPTAPRTTTAPAAPKNTQPALGLTLSKTITCSTPVDLRVSGSGQVSQTTITGPSQNSGSTSAEVSGPAGTYVASVRGSQPHIDVSWSGTCNAS